MAPMTPKGSCTTNEKRSGRFGSDFAVDLVERFGVVAERPDGAWDISLERVHDRLADVEAFEDGEAFSLALHQLRELEKNSLLVAVVELAPMAVLEGAPRTVDRGIDIGRVALGDMIEDAAVPRRDVGEGLARDSGHKRAVDHGLARKLQGACNRFKMRERCHHTKPYAT